MSPGPPEFTFSETIAIFRILLRDKGFCDVYHKKAVFIPLHCFSEMM